MLGIMAGMDQEAWFAGFDVVPRAVLLLVSQAPVIMAGLDHRTVWRFTGAVLGQGFLHARPTSVLVQSALHSLAFPQLQFFTVVDFLLRYRGLFHADHSVSPVAPVHVVDVPCYAGCAVSQVVCSSWTR